MNTEDPEDLTASDSCWLPRSNRSPGKARRFLTRTLSSVKEGERFLDKGELVLSELVTNALVHGTRTGQLIWIGLKVDGEQLWIAVEDPSSSVPVVCQASAAEGESGRGMLLVEKLSLAWGCGPREGIGKRVWVLVGPDQN
ncbi:ATP-binding protein [Kitasatospora sp. GAS204B]|uniref:ATP-binding protein n=1 Tax=unclassified Kitasatospora TaxID=2633591 RepID=UPI0024746073|nr:ATP-binding protein [Kitasatospora sp. GAS204B]MDH6116606.1 anti-sigma regulatory factor (Ser/Thr protein kinase) [Kitasatospora sp. GAS204B]